MIRSKSEDLKEYELIRDSVHVDKVWARIESSLSDYWPSLLEAAEESDSASKLVKKFGGALTSPATLLHKALGAAIESYEKDAEKYRPWFNAETLEEFLDDPNAFKQTLSRDVPIIANTLRQQRAELKDWQRHFREARPNDLLEVFSNVIDFVADWSDAHPPKVYAQLDAIDAFGLDPLDSDENMFIWNVIGMGIKSIVLYHLDPERLPARGQNALYGLYFLTKGDHFRLPTQTSEFLMIDDAHQKSGCILMDHNYWYPYGVFSLYALRIYRWIEAKAKAEETSLDAAYRFVYVEHLFAEVCRQHHEDLKTMRGHERFEAPL